MSLQSNSDQQFDREIKEYLDKVEAPYDPVSWEKMNNVLDRVFGSTDSDYLTGLFILAAILGGLFFWNLYSLQVSASENTASVISTISSGQVSTLTNQDWLESMDTEELVTEWKLSDEASKSSENQFIDNKLSPSPTNLKKSPTTSSSQNLPPDEDRLTTNNNTNTNSSVIQRVNPNGVQERNIVPVSPPSQIDSVNSNLITPIPVIRQKSSPLLIGVGYAPDISLVGFGEATTPGTNLALQIEYMLGSRWSINTGITYSMKKYKASGEDYNPPYGFWYYGKAPESADGECDVIDIPINIRYYFSTPQKHRFFASTGLSSYIMLSEDYYYHYQDYNNPRLVDSWHLNNENQHWFGIYNLSFGYQRGLGSGWFFEIEPFIKVPMSGVGFGQVDLWTTGCYFSVKYNF